MSLSLRHRREKARLIQWLMDNLPNKEAKFGLLPQIIEGLHRIQPLNKLRRMKADVLASREVRP